MKTKIKLIVASIMVSLSTTMTPDMAQAGTLVNPLTFSLTAAGLIVLSQTIPVLTKSLSDNLDDVETYFALHPDKLHPVETYLQNLLAQPQARSRYEHYKKLAEVLGMNNIPPYAGEPHDQPIDNINVEHNLGSTNHTHPNSSGQVPDKIIYSPQGEAIDVSTEFPFENIQTWDDYLNVKQNSVELAQNMANAQMGTRQPGEAAHHIVPATAPGASQARAILDSYGITINDAENGVYLPTKNGVLAANKNGEAVSGITHNGMHPGDYVNNVNQQIIDANKLGGEIAVRTQLEFIRNELKNAANNGDWRTIVW